MAAATEGNNGGCNYGKATRVLTVVLMTLILAGSSILIGMTVAAQAATATNLERIRDSAENMARIDERLKSIEAKLDELKRDVRVYEHPMFLKIGKELSGAEVMEGD